MNLDYLDFEQPIAVLEAKIEELQLVSDDNALNIAAEITTLREKSRKLTESIYSNLSSWQVVQIARHPLRPYASDYIPRLFTEFDELHGDRHFGDDRAIIGGVARIDDRPVVVIAEEKGRGITEKVRRNFGMPKPEGYRKALRLMELAERFSLPVLTLIDTPGAYPGIDSEERGISQAIAQNLAVMSRLRTPVICTVIGEGSSGGAIAIGVGDWLNMLQYSTYFVISPEGCANIIWKTAEKAPLAAEAMGVTSKVLAELGIVDETIPEPPTLFDDYSGRGLAAQDQQMTVADHLSPHDLKLAPQGGLTPAQKEVFENAYAAENKAFQEAKLTGKDLVRWKFQRYAKDYLRCVDAVDDNVGRVLDYLDESGLAKNTVVIYTSDQGWYLGEHGWYDKRWMYEESFRTPLLVRWPDHVAPGTVNKDMVMNLDFAQTFLAIAGASAPADMQGESLVPVFQGKTPADWRKEVYYHYYEFPQPHHVHPHYGVRTERYKLIYFYDLDEWELYDLEKDPQELHSLYADPDYAAVVKEMKANLDRLRAKYKDDGTEPQRQPAGNKKKKKAA